MIETDEKILILRNCLEQCETRLQKDNKNQPLRIIKEVISSILSVATGEIKATSEMEKNSKIGLFAVREFEPHDMEFANCIYKVIDINNELRNS
ncbi:hypothetical protein A3197_21540 [Candidatus Thiodiazotropha endoloripes]|nr:hypothetical protein A3197_21540 [Candidatus Thiodiazotropha endoloripes]